jgi:hypothetical protein
MNSAVERRHGSREPVSGPREVLELHIDTRHKGSDGVVQLDVELDTTIGDKMKLGISIRR